MPTMSGRVLDEAAFELAIRLERELTGTNAAVIVNACVYVLADLVLQAEQAQTETAEDAVRLIDRKLRHCIEEIRTALLWQYQEPQRPQ